MKHKNSSPQKNEPNTLPPQSSSFTSLYIHGHEFRSQAEFLGLPLIHITRGINPVTGRFRVARGITALGDIAVGGLVVGGVSFGVFSLGGVSLGLFAIGGLVFGGFAVGGIAIGAIAAIGGIAVSMNYALGGLAVTPQLTSIKGFAASLANLFTEMEK
jgi:hypothetical protein